MLPQKCLEMVQLPVQDSLIRSPQKQLEIILHSRTAVARLVGLWLAITPSPSPPAPDVKGDQKAYIMM